MPGRYGEELRRITRGQQGGPSAPDPAGDARAEAPAGSNRGPLIALVVVLIVAGGGWLLVRQMMADAKIQDCAMAGGKHCEPAEQQVPGR